MHTTKISIKQPLRHQCPNQDTIDSDELLGNLLAAMYQNGQIARPNGVYYPENGHLCAIVHLTDTDALDRQHFNRYGKHWLSIISDENITMTILGKDSHTLDTTPVSQSSALILFTSYDSLLSPIRDLATFNPVPLHHLPKTHDDQESHYNIVSWQAAYQALDALNIQGVNELFALTQLGDKDSQINQIGLEICQKLMTVLKRPVYYYLHQYYSYDFDNDTNRLCPNCHQHWRLDKPLHGMFDFKCDACHLLSNFAYYPISECK